MDRKAGKRFILKLRIVIVEQYRKPTGQQTEPDPTLSQGRGSGNYWVLSWLCTKLSVMHKHIFDKFTWLSFWFEPASYLLGLQNHPTTHPSLEPSASPWCPLQGRGRVYEWGEGCGWSSVKSYRRGSVTSWRTLFLLCSLKTLFEESVKSWQWYITDSSSPRAELNFQQIHFPLFS